MVTGLGVLKERFAKLMEQARQTYLRLTEGLSGDKALEAILEHFRDTEKRDEFYRFYEELQDLYEILSPDPFLRPFVEDYRRLSEMVQVLRTYYEARPIALADFLHKTAQLVQAHTHPGAIREPGAVYALRAEGLDALVEEERPDIIKVFNLRKAIRDLVEKEGPQQPYLFSIGEIAERIAQEFYERQLTTQQTLQQLVEGPIREIEQAEESRRQVNLDPESFAIFWTLQREGVINAQDVALNIEGALRAYPYWMTARQQEVDLRLEVNKTLLKAGVQVGRVTGLVERLLRMLRREVS